MPLQALLLFLTILETRLSQRNEHSTDIRHCRSLTNIILTCLSVIVICTWTSVHPNVPSVPRSSHWAFVYWDDFKITLVSLVAPELILLWAIRQRKAAGKILKKYKRHGWAEQHAYLALMGGFALYDQGEFKCHLWPEVYLKEHKEKELEVAREIQETMSPTRLSSEDSGPSEHPIFGPYSCLLECLVAEGYIEVDNLKNYANHGNLSHSDVMSKIIATIQTSWFITQCIACPLNATRAGLGQGSLRTLTELEVLTLSFAVLNGVTYIYWWNKPRRIRHPIHV
ncbi:hypothetical protein L218DRAFT_857433, partial [Marasmius fiardii PR-910]